jgi:peptidoglycan/xylan/chitin deacetylase (PgdA/CDA1 family)
MAIGRMTLKRAVKRATGCAAILTSLFSQRKTGGTILYYHRVADIGFIDSRVDDHNVVPEVFERQIAALADLADIVPLTELQRHARDRTASNGRPVVSLTFDDGYENFVSNALPVLKRFGAPATLSVVTSIVDGKSVMPFDGWAAKNRCRSHASSWRPITLRGIDKCLRTGLITLGAHSHSHRNARFCSPDEIDTEVMLSAELLRQRFGEDNVPVYAYPYGNTHLGHVPSHYENAVRNAGFDIAVTTDHGHVEPDTNPFLLPRIEAHGLDFAATLWAKIQGKLSPYYLHDYARSMAYAVTARKSGRADPGPIGVLGI